MASLVTLACAQQHLRLPVTATPRAGSPTGSPAGSPGSPTGSPVVSSDDDLELKMEQASDLVRTYLLRPDDVAWCAAVQGWTETSVPSIVQAAVLEQIADLYLHRGDEPLASPGGSLCPAAEAILRATGYRDPALA